MTDTFKRAALICVAVMVVFSLLFLTRMLVDIRDACAEPQEIGIRAASVDSGAVLVEPVALTVGVITTTGECSGYVTSTNGIRGELLDVYIDYGAGISSTCDLTFTMLSPWRENVLVVSDNATDGIWRPRIMPQFYNGVTITPTNAVPYWLGGQVEINIGQVASGTVGTAYIRYRRP